MFVYISLNVACMSRGQVARYIEFEHCHPFFYPFMYFVFILYIACSFNSSDLSCCIDCKTNNDLLPHSHQRGLQLLHVASPIIIIHPFIVKITLNNITNAREMCSCL